MPKSPIGDCVAQLTREFPQHGRRQLARLACDRWPELFHSEDQARDCLRYYSGAHGRKSRRAHGDNRREPSKQTPLPESRAESWNPFVLDASRVLILSDVHVPFHDVAALTAALKFGDERKPDCVLLNGDTADFYTISRYDTDPRKRDFPGEIAAVRQFLRHLRDRYPKARIVYKLGNHDERWLAYLWRKAPELLGLPQTGYESILGADDLGVELVQDQRIIQAGLLSILHGHELPKGLTNPVNPARGVFLRAVDIALIGHHHRTSEHTETTMMGRTITCWSTGCLCELHPEYARINRWNHGFAWLNLAADGQFRIENKRVRNGAIL